MAVAVAVEGVDSGSWTGILVINSSSGCSSWVEGSCSGAEVRGEFGVRGVVDLDRDSLGVRTTVSIGVIGRMVKDDRGEDLGIEGVEDFKASAYDRK